MNDIVKAHNELVMKIGASLEGVEADKASAAMLEVISINIVDASDGDLAAIGQLCQLATRTLYDLVEMHVATYAYLKAKGER